MKMGPWEPQENALRIKKKVERRLDRILDVKHPEKVERRLDRVPDVRHLGGMAAEKNFGCETSGWNGSGEEFWMRDIQVEWRRRRIPDVRHPDEVERGYE